MLRSLLRVERHDVAGFRGTRVRPASLLTAWVVLATMLDLLGGITLAVIARLTLQDLTAATTTLEKFYVGALVLCLLGQLVAVMAVLAIVIVALLRDRGGDSSRLRWAALAATVVSVSGAALGGCTPLWIVAAALAGAAALFQIRGERDAARPPVAPEPPGGASSRTPDTAGRTGPD